MWLKRRTPQNIVIGGAAGALPPVDRLGRGDRLGRARAGAAVPHHLPLDAAAFLGARAVSRRRLRARRRADAAGGQGRRRHARRSWSTRSSLAPIAVAPWLLGFAGAVYGVVAIALGAVMFVLCGRGVRAVAKASPSMRAAQRLFGFSILYLFALFAALLVEAVVTQALRLLA